MSDERTEHGPPSDPQQPAWPSAPEAGPPQWPSPPPVQPQAGPSGVHPLTIGRAFSLGWSLFRLRWRKLLGALLLPLLPAYALLLAWYVVYGEHFWLWNLALQPDPFDYFPDPAELAPFPLEGLVLFVVLNIAASLASAVGLVAMIYILGWTYGGSSASVAAAVRRGVALLPRIVGATLLIFVLAIALFAVVAGAVAALLAATGFQPGPAALLVLILVVAAVALFWYVALRWAFYLHAMVLEGTGAVGSLGRSWQVVGGSMLRLLGYLLAIFGVFLLFGLIVGLLGTLLFGLGVDFGTLRPEPYSAWRVLGQTALSTLASALILPFYMAVMTLLYYDLRWRRREPIGPPPG